MNIEQRARVIVELGKKMGQDSAELQDVFRLAKHKNGWFSEQSSQTAFKNWSSALSEEKVNQWISGYLELEQKIDQKRIGLIMAGNIPIVGLHDLITVLIAGHKAVVKLSSDDTVLMKKVIDLLKSISSDLAAQIEVVDRLKNIDAVIATGSNNSARYFEAYFGKYPNIIRHNRTSVAVLNGNETSVELRKLGKDIFTYYGLGCRNVTKLYVPENYDFSLFYESIIEYASVLDNIKYVHNYDYHKTLYLLNSEVMLDNEFLLIRQDTKLNSPIGVLHYEYVTKEEERLVSELKESANVQCVVHNTAIQFGETQAPALWDYADRVDTLRFLLNL